jgi:prepilin-type N-terminal cleavage/methylation domain-containing protein
MTRRDPQKGENGFSITQGFTLIELMIVVAVLAIVTSLALPSYRLIMEKRQVTSGAEQIKAFLSAAQLEAVKHNEYVAVSYQEGGNDAEGYPNWCFGMRDADTASNPTEVADCDCTLDSGGNACTVDGALRVIRSTDLNYPGVLDTGSMADGATIVFDPIRGTMANLGGSMAMELLSDQGHYAMSVDITPTGRVRVCSDTNRSERKVPGYDEC